MSVQETPTELWGGETTKAVANFPVSGERVPLPVVRWLGRIKGTAARVNAELGPARRRAGREDRRRGRRDRRGQARRAVPDRRLPDRLGHVVEHELQRGHRHALWCAHPNDHVNMGQSSNDVFPSRRAPRRAGRGDEHAAARAGAARGVVRGQGRGLQGHRQVRPHAPDGRGPGDAGPGVRGLRRADPARPASGSRTRCRRSRRSRSAAPPPAPASTPIATSRPRCARSWPPTPA